MPNHFTEEEVHEKLERLRVDILMLQAEIPAMVDLIRRVKEILAESQVDLRAGEYLETLARQYRLWSETLKDRHTLLMNLEQWVIMNGHSQEPVIRVNWGVLRRHLKRLKYHLIDFFSGMGR